MSNKISIMEEKSLSEISNYTKSFLEDITKQLGIERSVLPTDEQIKHVCENLYHPLSKIPSELRGEIFLRMCIAVASGLFDGAINYAWNAAIAELKNKVKKFGLHAVPESFYKNLNDNSLFMMKEYDLLNLCLNLNLISKGNHLILNQCREIRNNFSTAHIPIDNISEREVVIFIDRISAHVFNNGNNPEAVDFKEFTRIIKDSSFSENQYNFWCDKISNTYETQKDMIFSTLHGIYCNPDEKEYSRVNSITLCHRLSDEFSESFISLILNRHQKYWSEGEESRHAASKLFFQELKLLSHLTDAERHTIISQACRKLLSAHYDENNFYNEPRPAEGLAKIIEGQEVPSTAKHEFVNTVLLCAVGNPYGVSNAAEPFYTKMIKGFSRREVEIMFSLVETKSELSDRVSNYPRCRSKFLEIIGLIDPESVASKVKPSFENWLKVKENETL